MAYTLMQNPAEILFGDQAGSAPGQNAGQTAIALVVEYDGSAYAGFQFQPGVPTIQGELEKAIYKLTGQFCRVAGSSRTDSGVHAAGQVASFKTSSRLDGRSFIGGLNYYLPPDIAVKEAFRLAAEFDIRRRATGRYYRYTILNRASRAPLKAGFYWQVKGGLDIDNINAACRYLLGVHDFASFAPADYSGSTCRQLFRAEACREGDWVTLSFSGNAFLPHQVRNMVGPLVEVGRGRMSVEDFRSLLEARIPGSARPSAPSRGLVLEKIYYAKELKAEEML